MKLSEGILTVILVISVLCLTAFMDTKARNSEKQLKITELKLDSLQRINDCLSFQLDQAYRFELELNRYEVAYKIFLDRNPRAAEQYGTIISEETE